MGDLRLENLRKACKTHGMTGTPEHQTWAAIIQRCTNKNLPHYARYGGRGIKVCKRWRKFINFYADMGPRPKGRSIDRINPDGDYCPENCRWATPLEQSQNQRRIIFYKVGEESRCIADWSRITGVNRFTIHSRIKAGWEPERSITEPVQPISKRNRNEYGKFS